MTYHLRLRMLGSPSVLLNDEPVTGFRSSKAQALLFYLIATKRPHTRAALAGLFWGDVAEQYARRSLTSALSNLRQLVGDYVTTTRDTVAFAHKDDNWLDIDAFFKGIAANTVESLQQAVALYEGDFLEGVSLSDAPEFEQWLLTERTHLRESMLQALHTLAMQLHKVGAVGDAISMLRRLLNLEPWHEEAHRQLMLLLAQSGQRSAALAHFERCRQILAQELGIEPDAETMLLAEKIRTDQVEKALAIQPPPIQDLETPDGVLSTVQAPPDITTPATQPTAPIEQTISHNLPAALTPFVGRKHEMAAIAGYLQEPSCRLLTLAGPGGIGKTRLALAVAQFMLESPPASMSPAQDAKLYFQQGVFFIALQSIDSLSGLIAAIANAIGFQFYSDSVPRQQLLDYLYGKRMLLILDSVEQLLRESLPDALDFLEVLMTVATDIKLLVTSQEALKLQEEWFYPLAGLSFTSPTAITPIHAAQESQLGPTNISADSGSDDAIQLFVQNARRAQPTFAISPVYAHVLRICRLVDGNPLGIELATAWLKVLSCDQIADEIARGLDILTTRHHNTPERHRSMRVVLEQSWQLLMPEEQKSLCGLSTLLGAFDLHAARQIADASPHVLAALVEKSWLYLIPDGRYRFHELLRQYADDQLRETPEHEAAMKQAHSKYYLAFLIEREEQISGKGQQQALAEVTEAIDNIQAGWRWAVLHQNVSAVLAALEGLFWFYVVRRRSAEGQEIFAETLAQLEANGAIQNTPDGLALRATLLRKLGVFDYFLGEYERARSHLEESLEILRGLERRQEVAYTLNVLGVLNGWQGHPVLALEQLHECLALAREFHDLQTASDVLHELAQIKAHAGQFAEAQKLAEEGLTLCRQLGRPDWTAHSLDTLGWITFCLGEYDHSQRYYQESLDLFQELNHHLGESLALGGLGLVAWANNDLREAYSLVEQSLSICRANGNRLHMANHLADLAQIASDMGDPAALGFAREGLAIAEEIGSPIFTVYNRCSLGAAAGERQDWHSGRTELTAAIQSAIDAQLLPSLMVALFQYARLLIRESTQASQSIEQRQTLQDEALRVLTTIVDHPACLAHYRHLGQQMINQIAPGNPTSKQPPELSALLNSLSISLKANVGAISILE